MIMGSKYKRPGRVSDHIFQGILCLGVKFMLDVLAKLDKL